jgi:transcription initiation factor TFIIB
VVVESRIIDERSEWRTFNDKDKEGGDPSRVGGPINPLLSDGGLSTMISGGKGVDRGLAANLQRLQARTEVGADRNLILAFKEIGKICSAMKLPEVVKFQANEYYRDAMQKSKAVKGKQHAAVFSAVIFLACRQQGYPRTFKEICTIVPQVKVKDIGRIYKAIVNDLQLKETGQFKSEVNSIHPENFVRRFMSVLGLTNADMNRAVALANAILPREGPDADTHRPWHGKSPLTVAGTIIYILANLPGTSQVVTLEEISSVCGVAEQTINLLYKEMYPSLPELLTGTKNVISSLDALSNLPVPVDVSKTKQIEKGKSPPQEQRQPL